MRIVVFCMLFLSFAVSAHALQCPDVEEAAKGAISERNTTTSTTYNTTIADPEAEREDFSH